MKLARRIFALHSWSGLIAGLFILVFFLTGSVIVFREELNLWEHPHLLRVEPKNQRLPYQTIYERVRDQVTDTYLYSFRNLPRTPEETIEMRIYEPSTKRYGLLYVNPYNGQVLGKTFDSLYDILLTIHYQFYLGKFGEFLATLFALALIGSVLTGLYVYRKSLVKVLLFQFSGRWTNWRTISSNLHRILGVWGLLFNLVLALSGFWMLKYTLDVQTHFSNKPSVEETQAPPAIMVNLDNLVQQTQTLFGGRVNNVSFPRQKDGIIQVYATSPSQSWLYGDYSSYAEFDQQTGAVKTVFRESDLSKLERFEYALYTLHFGQYGGLPIKILYAFLSLSGAVLTVTGFLLWFRRIRFRKQVALVSASEKGRLRPVYSVKS
ncbi:PepSY-associated TM helix domain protein [Fibrisoma limi BUZ 3]|uniref:PepSY-associated TM helix domain protein n=1 Tax=Fibrisoma limi BUZ 3 TaxID=1185876 RepID=I2GBG9_9BACT|nr:PepSY-associated TM helix domain-containing protein [Fibrisoma limi]CCH51243.1 PepSY-associated TM helix domain protein [Fibrisoma limi BUZ 3]